MPNLGKFPIFDQKKIMSDDLKAKETEWLSKLAAMRDAIAKLNLPTDSDDEPIYGQDLNLSDDDFLYHSGSDDIWGVISADITDSSDHEPPLNNGAAHSAVASSSQQFDRHWLQSQCAAVAGRSQGFDAEGLTEQILAVVSSDSSGRSELLDWGSCNEN